MNNLAQRLSSLNTEVIVSIVVYTYEATAQLVSRLLHQRVSENPEGLIVLPLSWHIISGACVIAIMKIF